ncbi:serine hydrolase domain-containing protein [Mycobacterium avium]|uniref:serine hydrolase domain-containing protein n=1 Tax=Mycobacterium avium TaxID=1764 RepID=UPI001CC47CE3|nr:serine hydrolase domain-containing protein [Mycobacterium avium]MBZ4521804.1 beta-lactamase family protein [Mycobacterium avium subsp. hominissuis]MBZ4531184.1 beta-lactamase family protein [Mycobacterium avium subsp. hominissuis]
MDGTVAPGFEAVRAAFLANFETGYEVGASVAVYVDGVKKVDIWHGDARPATAWQSDTLVPCFSVAKAILATAVAILAERGRISMGDAVSRYWPEFAAGGKQSVTIEQLITHTAGLAWFEGYEDVVSFDDPASFKDTAAIVARLAAAEPLWEPGSQFGSHSITIGWLLGTLIERVSGCSVGEFIAREIAASLGGQIWVGLPPVQHRRAADLIPDPFQDSDELAAQINHTTPPGRALLLGPKLRLGTAISAATNDAGYRSVAVPAANTFTDARTLAHLYSVLSSRRSDARPLRRETVRAHTDIVLEGRDAIFGVTQRYGMGFLRPTKDVPLGPSDDAFGYPGQGGQLALGDLGHGLGFAYLPNRAVMARGADPRADALLRATYSCLE